jgi:hypothetical protein
MESTVPLLSDTDDGKTDHATAAADPAKKNNLSSVSSAPSSALSRFVSRHAWTLLLLVGSVVFVIVLLTVSIASAKRDVKPHALLATTTASLPKTAYAELTEGEVMDLFTAFQQTYGRTYADADETAARLQNFMGFLAEVDARNADEARAGGTATHGVTLFSDYSAAELRDTYLGGYVAPSDSYSSAIRRDAEVPTYTGHGRRVDWTGILTTAGVSDQGYCASCWAFSAVAQVESDAIRAGLLTVAEPLSVQQLVSCDVFSQVTHACPRHCHRPAFPHI